MTEQYIKKVLRYIPKNKKREIEEKITKDMKSIITKDTTEDEVIKVLNALGHPKLIAEKYCDTKHYLIGPDLYTSYLNVLIIVMIVTLVMGFVLPFYNIFSIQANQNLQIIFFDLLKDIFTTMINYLFYGFTIITLMFAFFEQMNVKPESQIDFLFKYKPKKLTDHSYLNEKSHIHLKLIFTILLMPILILFLYYFKIEEYNLINLELFDTYFPFIIIYFAMYIIIEFLKTIVKDWNLKLAFIDIFVKIFSILLFSTIFFSENIINNDLELFLMSKGTDLNTQLLFLMILLTIIVINIIGAVKTIKIAYSNKK